jgi:hypothetical protein
LQSPDETQSALGRSEERWTEHLSVLLSVLLSVKKTVKVAA